MVERNSDPGVLVAGNATTATPCGKALGIVGAPPQIPANRYAVCSNTVLAPIECFFGKLKNQRRVTTQCDHTLNGCGSSRLFTTSRQEFR
jgi:hypothetical protein